MDWYKVTKTIHGRKYLYWQKTYRVGGSVKTLNKYIGPSANPPRIRSLKSQMQNLPQAQKELRKQYDGGKMTKTEYLEAITVKDDAVVEAAATIENSSAFQPVVLSKTERNEDERIQYGNLKARIKKHKSKIRAAKRNSKGIKTLNPFVAQTLVKNR